MLPLSKNTLLLLVDIQIAIDHPSWGERNNPDAEQNMSKLIDTWRGLSMPIIHIKHMSTNSDSHYRSGQIGNDFKKVVAPLDNEEIIEKDSNNAFIRTKLEETLRERKINDIVIVGVITNNSIEATARMSGNLGFRTIVVSDATFTFDKADYVGNIRTAQEVHDMSLANLENEYAEIMNTIEVINRL